MNGIMSCAPKEQLSPRENMSACATDVSSAWSVCPERVRPLLSETVTESMIGTFLPMAVIASWAAKSAALALSVSNIVSIRNASTPPWRSASICS